MSQDLFSVIKIVIERLEKVPIEYMVVGSVASIIYGEPRLTKDRDLVVEFKGSDAVKFEEAFQMPDF